MLKIKKLTIENFRGLKNPIELNFFTDGKPGCILLYGSNGTGKSSIIDAWEWFNNGGISLLRREGVESTDIPHRLSWGESCYVLAEFDHTEIESVKVTFDPKRTKNPIKEWLYDKFRSLNTYPNHLRYSDLQEFVYQTKTDRYNLISKIFGIKEFSDLQATIKTALNKQQTNFARRESDLLKQEQRIKEKIPFETFTPEIVINFINNIAEKYHLNRIATFEEVNSLRLSLEEIVNKNPLGKELAEWLSFTKKQEAFYPLKSIKARCEKLESMFSDLKKDKATIKKLGLIKLYEASEAAIKGAEEWNKNECPVCDSLYDGDLLIHITKKHSDLHESEAKIKLFDDEKILLEEELQEITRKITEINSENGTYTKIALKNFFGDVEKINQDIPIANWVVKKDLLSIKELDLSSKEWVQSLDKIIKEKESNLQMASDEIKRLESSEWAKIAKDYSSFLEIMNDYQDYVIIEKKKEYLRTVVSNLESLWEEITTFIEMTIQKSFEKIAPDVREYFHMLEEDSKDFIKNPQLKVNADSDKSVELEIEFVGENIKPAFKFLSESQINSFALSVFLASVKNFNPNFKFFILDDVVNSFDSFKRPILARLLHSKFNDFQILVTTHDDIFSNTVQRKFPEWKRYKFNKWSYTHWPQFKLNKSYTEEIQLFIDADEAVNAGGALGRYLEWTLGELNENLLTPIRYKAINRYTLIEHLEPLCARVKKELKENHKLSTAFKNLSESSGFRNFCAHWDNSSSPITTREVKEAFGFWKEIEQIMYCNKCREFVSMDTNSNIRCCCSTGGINLRDPEFYNT